MNLSFIVLVFALILTALGCLIKYKKVVEIIAGYDPQRIKDKEGFANWVGGNIIFLGVTGILFGAVGLLIHSRYSLTIVIVYSLLIMITVFRTAVGGNKYYS